MARRPTSPGLRRFTDKLSATPALAFAVGNNSLFVKFGFAMTAGDLAPSDWDITVAANGGAPAAQTTTGSVATADGLVVLSVSGTPFKLPPEEEQAIVLTYTPTNTQTDLQDAAGRQVAGFTYNSILPRISDWRKAAYLLMAEQAGNPSGDPDTGYWWAFFKSDGLYVENSAGTVTGPLGAGGPGGSGATVGTTEVDFGTFPGASDTSVAVTGQTSILAGAVVTAWLQPADTADHTADEHVLETIRITAGNIVAGTGFTIYAANTSQLNEPLVPVGAGRAATAVVGAQASQAAGTIGGTGTRIYGAWKVGWSWQNP